MTLNAWQERLQKHFSSLRDQRFLLGKEHPIFALEHGLSVSETAELCADIRGHITDSQPLPRHWLAWVVYATELGYKFSGDEYWQSFAESTPGWMRYENRYFIRDAFFSFRREFNGACPSGRWAEHFSIICWPIAHAILPQDLQLQLAEVLYGIRDLFTADLLQSPALLGEQIEAYSWTASSRFRNFAEEHLLVGQIATALLLTEEEQSTALILATTLQRIATDLDRNRRSREWLQDAQRRATTVRLRGLRRGFDEEEPDADDGISQSEGRRTIIELGLEPRTVLRRLDLHTWDVRLELPDLSRLLTRFPNFQDILANQRCLVAGAKGPPRARGFLLHGPQEVSLASWPNPTDVLLKFENSTPQLDYLLTAECLLRPGPAWVFKVLKDGSAMEIRGRTIQPGHAYIVLSRADSGLPAPGIQTTVLKTTCAGVKAFRFDAPDTISQIYSAELSNLGLQASSGLIVTPVGLPAARWDDEGYAEWLISDHPTIAISADFTMSGLALNLVGPSPSKIEIPVEDITSPIFIDLGPLETGHYKLHVITAKPFQNQPLVGTLSLLIRPTRIENSRATPFSVIVSPPNPYLEQLWDGSTTIEILGPQARTAKCDISFFEDQSKLRLIHSKTLPSIDIPCTSTNWEHLFDALKTDVRVQNAYDESALCSLHIRCEELGQFQISCERRSTPVRWILKQENRTYSLRLAQLDEQNSVSVSHYTFQRPDQFDGVTADFTDGFRVLPEGGLYVAAAGRFLCAIVVPPHIQSFADLGLKIDCQFRKRTEQEISQLLNTLELWSNARVTGDPISRNKKQRVISAIKHQLISMVCGDFWAKLEQNLTKSSYALADLRNAISDGATHSPIGRTLLNRQDDLKQYTIKEACDCLHQLIKQYLSLPGISLAADHGTSSQRWIVEFAFRLMGESNAVREWAGADFFAGLHYVLPQHVLLRVARLTVLLRNSESAPFTISQKVGTQ